MSTPEPFSGSTTWFDAVVSSLGTDISSAFLARDRMPTIELLPQNLLAVAAKLAAPPFDFVCLLDLCGVDYLDYGQSEWHTHSTTSTGFSRAVHDPAIPRTAPHEPTANPRFATVYHVLSVFLNQRIRLRVWLNDDNPIPSVISVWPAANWYERETFDLFGIRFSGHPDLRRLLTDYGFKGHPFRKDFPLIGEVELHYDAASGRCVYGPVSIEPRVNIPKVIRK